MDKPVYNKGLSGEKPFWVDKPVNNKGLSGGKPFPQTKQMEYYNVRDNTNCCCRHDNRDSGPFAQCKCTHRQPFLTDKADFYFDEMYSRYAAQKNPKDFTAEDESIIWEYASNHIAMFLTWVIDNGFYGNIHYEASDDIQLVKARKMTGTEFLAKHCDYRLSDEDFSPEILPFVECYYFQKYIQQYDKLFSKKAMALLHPSPFSWEDYDLIAKRITRAYKLRKFCGSGK